MPFTQSKNKKRIGMSFKGIKNEPLEMENEKKTIEEEIAQSFQPKREKIKKSKYQKS